MPVIGIDFDHTLVDYDAVLYRLARQRGLLGPRGPRGKKAIRDAIRRRPEGERQWQQVQAVLYSTAIAQARPSAGVAAFLAACRRQGVEVYIVSHKTRVAPGDAAQTDLHAAAFAWLRAQGFLAPGGVGLREADVFFEPSREAKLARIAALGCTHFIDDLPEALLAPAFPPQVERLLYDPHRAYRLAPPVRTFRSWSAIHAYFFGR
ncbi:MAG: hypothetical protein KatS3mg131_1078 [Candidatus Tectimicrobiota bacterium]|nr:MAG: hypothetical protein KatS3mg131_1078 [Candidatus Tectomicrobia bacterium]